MIRKAVCFMILACLVLIAVLAVRTRCAYAEEALEVSQSQQTVEEWAADLKANPPKRDPMRDYGFKAEVPWTDWNKFWFGSAIAGQAVDTITTIDAIGAGNCHEANPLFGEDPNASLIVAVKLAALGFNWWVTEYWVDEANRQKYRNWTYATMAVTGMAAGAWNASQDCQ